MKVKDTMAQKREIRCNGDAVKLLGDWHALEHWQNGPARWIDRDASIRIHSPTRRDVNLSFDMISFHTPRILEIHFKKLLNKQIVPITFKHQELNLALEPGENILKFIVIQEGNRPCDMCESTDSRSLSVAFQNLRLWENATENQHKNHMERIHFGITHPLSRVLALFSGSRTPPNFLIDGAKILYSHIGNEIDPKQLMKDLTVEELCSAADLHYKVIEDPSYLIARPFSDPSIAHTHLFRLGLLFSGLYLGKTMSVLDFGAGSCWLSRWLNQMQCSTISVDCSSTALEIGKRLFDDYPLIGEQYLHPPQFLQFDGHSLNMESESVDRVICFDAFHHVPNQAGVLRELYRVTKPGGSIGFSEPGREHSSSPESQMEMRYFKVLENDINLEEIWQTARAIGFNAMRIKAALDYDIGIEDYLKITSNEIPKKVSEALSTQTRNSSVFFLMKGNFMPDSRCIFGLMHHMELIDFKPGNPAKIEVKIKNTGQTKWLHKNIRDIGIVKLGAHLYDYKNNLLKEGFCRIGLERDILPGETVNINMDIPMSTPGRLALDLVSEQVAWFEKLGAKPIYVDYSA